MSLCPLVKLGKEMFIDPAKVVAVAWTHKTDYKCVVYLDDNSRLTAVDVIDLTVEEVAIKINEARRHGFELWKENRF